MLLLFRQGLGARLTASLVVVLAWSRRLGCKQCTRIDADDTELDEPVIKTIHDQYR